MSLELAIPATRIGRILQNSGYVGLVIVTSFLAGKYFAWQCDHPERMSKGFFKDWQVAGIMALMIGTAIVLTNKK